MIPLVPLNNECNNQTDTSLINPSAENDFFLTLSSNDLQSSYNSDIKKDTFINSNDNINKHQKSKICDESLLSKSTEKNSSSLVNFDDNSNVIKNNCNKLYKTTHNCEDNHILKPPLPVYNQDTIKFLDVNDKESSYSTTICNNEYEHINNDSKTKIPDGEWGWIVVLASLILSMVADGISFSFGLLYIEFLDYFGESNSKTSWIGSLFMSVPLLSGPIMSALVDKYGCRKMTMLGGIISCTGFVMAAFSNSIEMLFLTFGIIAGLGLGMCYVTAVVAIAFWFDKKRTLAIGLGACGTGIGTFIYAPMTQYFIDEYGWRGTVLLLAGTFLNMCVCGAVMRDPEWLIETQKNQSLPNKSIRGTSSCGSVSKISGGGESMYPGIEDLKMLIKSGETPEYILTQLAMSITIAENADSTIKNKEQLCNSVVNIPTFIKQNEKVPLEVLELLSSRKELYDVILENYPSLLSCRSCSENKLNKLSLNKSTSKMPVVMSMKVKALKKVHNNAIENPGNNNDLVNSPLLNVHPNTHVINNIKIENKPTIKTYDPWYKKQFSGNHNYLKDIRIHRNSVMHRGAMMNIAKYRLRASSCPNIYRNSIICLDYKEEKWYNEVLDIIKNMFDFQMFCEFHFLLMSLSTILLFIWFIVPYFYIAEYMTIHGHSEEDGAMQLSVIGLSNAIGMIFLGWAGDQPWMNVTKAYALCLILCGLSTLLYPLIIHSYNLLILVSALFGIFFASNYAFTPTILVDLIPLERFTITYGLILLSQGIGNLIGPPLAGLIYDILKSWDICFYLSGICIIISGILIAIIPFTNNFHIGKYSWTEKKPQIPIIESVNLA